MTIFKPGDWVVIKFPNSLKLTPKMKEVEGKVGPVVAVEYDCASDDHVYYLDETGGFFPSYCVHSYYSDNIE